MGSPDPVALMRFKSEFRYTAALAHPNLVKLYELGVANDTWFFTIPSITCSARAISRLL